VNAMPNPDARAGGEHYQNGRARNSRGRPLEVRRKPPPSPAVRETAATEGGGRRAMRDVRAFAASAAGRRRRAGNDTASRQRSCARRPEGAEGSLPRRPVPPILDCGPRWGPQEVRRPEASHRSVPTPTPGGGATRRAATR